MIAPDSPAPSYIPRQKPNKAVVPSARLSRVCGQTLPNQFESLDFSVNGCRWRNQYDPVTFKLDTANQVRVYPVLYGGDFDVMDYFVTVERVSSGISNKCLESLGLLFRKRLSSSDSREALSSA